jgi:hypothetical protein
MPRMIYTPPSPPHMTQPQTMKRRYLRISSEEKTPESKSNSEFVVNIPPSGGILDSVVGYAVHSAELPNVFDNITADTNTLQIIDNIAVAFNVVVPPGYYSATALAAVLQDAIDAAIAPRTVAITLTGATLSQRFRFAFSVPFVMVAGGISTMAPAIGLTATTALNNVQIMPNIPNLIGATAAYIHSSVLAPSNLVEANGSFSVVDMIQMDKPYGVTCYLTTSNELTHIKYYRPFESVKTLRQISITIRDRGGNVLLLPPNFNFSMMLVVFYA